MATKIQTPLSKAAASGKIAKGAVVNTKKKTSPSAAQATKKVVPTKKAPAKKQLVEEVEGNDIVVKGVPVKKTKEPKERKETANSLTCKLILEQKWTDEEISVKVAEAFPGARQFISIARSDMNAGRIYQSVTNGKLPLNPIYKNEAGRIVAKKPSKAKTEEKKQPVKKAAISLLKKTKDSLPKE